MEIKRKKENKAKENYHLSFLLLSLSLSLISFSPPRNDTSNHSRVTQRANEKKRQKAQKKKKLEERKKVKPREGKGSREENSAVDAPSSPPTPSPSPSPASPSPPADLRSGSPRSRRASPGRDSTRRTAARRPGRAPWSSPAP